jgi:hypothetical protein
MYTEIKLEYIHSSGFTLDDPLLNLASETCVIPTQGYIGTILPIYKNKGDTCYPEKDRPSTLLSCVSKVFTSVLNNRLNQSIYISAFNS